jgi:hypothetical protein
MATCDWGMRADAYRIGVSRDPNQVIARDRQSSRRSLDCRVAWAVAAEFSALGGAGMGGVTRRSEFADYHAMGGGVAIMLSVSISLLKIGKQHLLEQVFDLIACRINNTGTSCPESITFVKSGMEVLRWN